jgi:hypothetical protein
MSGETTRRDEERRKRKDAFTPILPATDTSAPIEIAPHPAPEPTPTWDSGFDGGDTGGGGGGSDW